MTTIYKPLLLACAVAVSVAAQAADKQDKKGGNNINALLDGDYRADKVPAGDAGRYYLPNAAAALDAINPSSYSTQMKINANFRAGLHNRCGDMDFYTNFKQEIDRIGQEFKRTIKEAQNGLMTSLSGALSSFTQYAIMKINPTLGELATKHLDERKELFSLQLKQCQDYERDVREGKNPLGEIGEIAIAEQWKQNIGLVTAKQKSLGEVEENIRTDAYNKGVTMADGKQYGGRNQEPVNISKVLTKAGMNLLLQRGNKDDWDSDFSTDEKSVLDNPILAEFKNPEELYKFVQEIYGSIETRLTPNVGDNDKVKSLPGKGYEPWYVKYRDEYYQGLRDYVASNMEREAFEKKFRQIIPPIEVDELRAMPPYERAVEIERRAQQYGVNRLRNNLIFAKQALKTGITAPDLQQSGMKGPSEVEFKSLYYRMQDDIREIGQRVWNY